MLISYVVIVLQQHKLQRLLTPYILLRAPLSMAAHDGQAPARQGEISIVFYFWQHLP
jgi:hypothetical protein